jgi:hypothetical protein
LQYSPLYYKEVTDYISQFLILSTSEITNEMYDLFNLDIPDSVLMSLQRIEQYGFKDYELFDKANNYYANELSDFGANNEVYLYAQVISDRDLKIVIETDLPGYSKLWVNSRCISICSKRQEVEHFTINLMPGKNEFIVGYKLMQKNIFPPYMYIQLFPYIEIAKNIQMPIRKKEYLEDKVKLVTRYDKQQNIVDFMLLTNNAILKSCSTILEKESIRQKLVLQTRKKYTYQIKENNTSLQQVKLHIDISPGILNLYNQIPEKEAEDIINQAIIYSQNITYGKGEILGRIEKYRNKLTFTDDRYTLLKELRHLLKKENISKSSRRDIVYYYSDIDMSYQELIIHLPVGYNAKKQYALIVCLGILDFDYITPQYYYDDSDCYLIANCAGRGILGGSYISEACYLEAIEYIKFNYSIDSDRIYLTGKSNGGYAVWSLIQNHPDMIAGACPISGYAYEPNISNVTNIPIINHVSNKDSCYRNNENNIKNAMIDIKNYKQIELKNQLHHVVANFSNYSLYKIFIDKVRSQYPRHIYYRTERNRYLKSYWIRLYGIKYGFRYSCVSAHIISERKISVKIQNTDGFRIDIPPMIDKRDFILLVNGRIISLKNYQLDTIDILFLKENELVVNPQADITIDYAKGNGLLDVYTGPMRIIIPDTDDKMILAAAKSFANPQSNGYYSQLAVHYPIYYTDTITESELNKHLVLINVDVESIRKKLCIAVKISIFNDSIEYLGRRFYGEYCVMQIVPNPNSSDKSILLVHTNDTSMLRKNMFIRKIVLPFANNGLHEYWNNEALILINNTYYRIYEWGDAIEEI